ncbi:MAG: acetylornithine transaminase [Phycisphaeraceae bacterium]|nr:acetylornithine transaminase [Phycisphaeraceae bacterium]
METAQDTRSLHDRWMMLNYPRWPITMVSGSGSKLVDDAGTEYLDLFSGFGAGVLGHCHSDLVAAATKQVNKLWHVGNLLHTEPQVRLAEQIAETGFGGRSYFCHSGSDANEAAFKLARLYGEGRRHKILSTEGSFHGRGFAAMMATGQAKVKSGYEPYLEGFAQVPYNNLEAMAGAIDDQTVAILIEPIQGEGGIHVPNKRYLTGLRKLCDDHDLLLICDEVWTGCGRTGRWYGHQHWDVTPDIMTLGKAVGAGLPVGVMCAAEHVADRFNSAKHGGVPHATTLGGNCVAMAVSLRMFEVLRRDDLIERAETLGETVMQKLRDFAADHPLVTDVRGKGLMIGLELDLDQCRFDSAFAFATECLSRKHLLIGSAQQNVLRLAPPLNIDQKQLEEGLGLLFELLEKSAA